jgi:putative transposase
MVCYRRNRVPGGTCFFTATLRDRGSTLLIDHVAALRETYARVARERPFRTDAIVVLPDHIHAIWTLPEGDDDYSARWRAIKAGFVRNLVRAGFPVRRNPRGEADIWQRRFWKRTMRDETDYATHCDYIHYNPVKHGFVAGAAEWAHSSFRRFVAAGVYPPDWAGERRG